MFLGKRRLNVDELRIQNMKLENDGTNYKRKRNNIRTEISDMKENIKKIGNVNLKMLIK